MQTSKLMLPLSYFGFFILCLLTGQHGVQASSHRLLHHHHHHHHHSGNRLGGWPQKLFVFGDSYADTGNTQISGPGAWKYPYGITFPGKPAGRFSDGRVFTDYTAKFLGLKSPIPYKFRKIGGKHLRYGMNFAVGGTGVFQATSEPNMTTQIGYLQNLMKKGSIYTQQDLQSSLVLVTLSGNDYSWYLSTNGSAEGFPAFITSVVNQMTVNLKQIHGLGAKKVAVGALQPLGCLPRSTAMSSYQKCDDIQNSLVNFHNLLLQQAVAKLNNETKDTTFFIINLYDSFLSVLNQKDNSQGTSKFPSPLKPCCVGISSQYFCGSLDDKGNKMYTVCQDPESAFFWDSVHPTQEGWKAVYNTLKRTFQQELH